MEVPIPLESGLRRRRSRVLRGHRIEDGHRESLWRHLYNLLVIVTKKGTISAMFHLIHAGAVSYQMTGSFDSCYGRHSSSRLGIGNPCFDLWNPVELGNT